MQTPLLFSRMNTTWIEISRSALKHNIKQFKQLIGPDILLSCCVKGNAYGHGLIESARIMINSGVDWLSVNALYEARELRETGVTAPIYIMGYVPLEDLHEIPDLDARLVVYNMETLKRLEEIGREIKVHLKLETGNNRQGIRDEDLPAVKNFLANTKFVQLEGATTHFANIEDTLDHSFAMSQLEKFNEMTADLDIKIKHCANSAATILFKKTHFDMVRVGIGVYGMWPSPETRVSVERETNREIELKPVITWKTIIAQVKNVPSGEYIGYGCTCRVNRDSRVAVLPVGYYDGYDRSLSGRAHVLIHGKRAPLLGRVCMNMIMVDVTDIPESKLEDEATLLGRQGEEKITAEQMGEWASTINYEITTRINERIPRVLA